MGTRGSRSGSTRSAWRATRTTASRSTGSRSYARGAASALLRAGSKWLAALIRARGGEYKVAEAHFDHLLEVEPTNLDARVDRT